jgi:hypothetical protein
MKTMTLHRLIADPKIADKFLTLSEMSRILKREGVVDRTGRTLRNLCVKGERSGQGQVQRLKSIMIGGNRVSTLTWFLEYLEDVNGPMRD